MKPNNDLTLNQDKKLKNGSPLFCLPFFSRLPNAPSLAPPDS